MKNQGSQCYKDKIKKGKEGMRGKGKEENRIRLQKIVRH